MTLSLIEVTFSPGVYKFYFIFQYTRVMVLLENLPFVCKVAILSNFFRVLARDVSCTWPAPDLLCFFPYGFFWDRFFLATLANLHVGFSLISFTVVFYFLGTIKVGYNVAPRPYPIFSMICCLCCFLFFC